MDENTDSPTTSDDSGAFLFENLKPGRYAVAAAHAGFAKTNLNGISLLARQDLRVSVVTSIASEATTVEIASAADQIDTEDALISDSKSNIEITQLPLNNRATTTSPLGALSLSPNVQQNSAGNIAIGGASSSQVNFSVDGVPCQATLLDATASQLPWSLQLRSPTCIAA